MHHAPHHSLERIKECIRESRYQITESALNGAGNLSLGEDDILDCVKSLHVGSNFHESYPGMTGLNHDVYKTSYEGRPIFVKLQLEEDAGAVVISFKRDTSPDSRYGQ